MEKNLTTTTFKLDGYAVRKNLGVVRGIVVRSRSVFGTLGGMLHTLIGGNITLFTELCERTRDEAFEMMVSHAEEMGANGRRDGGIVLRHCSGRVAEKIKALTIRPQA
jgi:uncharacterized protein YbjQ (UPF0145 family)